MYPPVVPAVPTWDSTLVRKVPPKGDCRNFHRFFVVARVVLGFRVSARMIDLVFPWPKSEAPLLEFE